MLFRSIIFKNITLVVLLFVLFSCGSSEGVFYDYSDKDKTLYLSVDPANNKLSFQEKKRGDVLKYKLCFSTEKLTPIGLDNDSNNYSYGDSFENNPPFNAGECLRDVATNGCCWLSIKMLDTAQVGDSGFITLNFFYNEDTFENTINEVKQHELTFEYIGGSVDSNN